MKMCHIKEEAIVCGNKKVNFDNISELQVKGFFEHSRKYRVLSGLIIIFFPALVVIALDEVVPMDLILLIPLFWLGGMLLLLLGNFVTIYTKDQNTVSCMYIGTKNIKGKI